MINGIKAVFKKQVKDTFKNMGVLVQFIVFPAVAFAMTLFVAQGNDDIPDTMFANMMAAVFVGMALIPTVAGFIAEDKERKSLRFLAMAGVKPGAYLLGIGGTVFLLSAAPIVAFGFIAGLEGAQFMQFVAAMFSGVAASTLIGLSIGIFTNSQQEATGLSMPVAMVLGFGPMIAEFNETVEQLFAPFYTQQFNVITNSFTGYGAEVLTWQPFAIIWANVAVLVVLFVVAFAKKGLKA